MICFMPFTYVDDRCIRKLTNALGPVSIFNPDPEIIPDHMLAWAQEAMLDLRYPQGVPAGQLARALQEFKTWADLHRGEITDMVGFFKIRQGRPPLVDETNPTAIGDQIRNFGQHAFREPTDSIFRAALFLAMAQEYDQQHDAVAQDLGAVIAMEQGMLARLAGEDPDPIESFSAASAAGRSADVFDAGAFMTADRVQAWAELARADSRSELITLFVTSSPAVLEYLLDRSAQTQEPMQVSLTIENGQAGDSDKSVLKALKTLASSEDPAGWSPDGFQDRFAGTPTADLVIYALKGMSPHRFLYNLSGPGSSPEPAGLSGKGPINTLIGLLQ